MTVQLHHWLLWGQGRWQQLRAEPLDSTFLPLSPLIPYPIYPSLSVLVFSRKTKLSVIVALVAPSNAIEQFLLPGGNMRAGAFIVCPCVSWLPQGSDAKAAARKCGRASS